MENFFENLWLTLTAYLPTLLLAIGILIIGWIIALAVSALVRAVLRRTTLDDRIANMVQGVEGQPPENVNVERWISTVVFWVIILFTVLAFLQALNLTTSTGPFGGLLNDILSYVPGILVALVLLLIAWIVASLIKMVVVRLLTASGLARRLSTDAGVKAPERVTISQTIGNVAYWLVFLLFLPAILDALNLQGILAPVQRMVDEILGVLPNLLAAVLIFGIGWLVARVIRSIVTNLLVGIGVDNLGGRAGVSTGQLKLSDAIGTVVYILVLIPVIVAALNALNIPAISEPASNMLNILLNALPAIFGAALLLAIAYFVARLVGRLVASLLSSIGFNRLFAGLGLFRGSPAAATRVGVYPPVTPAGDSGAGAPTRFNLVPSEIVGWLVTVAILLFAVMEAANLLGFAFLAELVSDFIVVAGQVLAGLIIFGIGLWLSSLAARVIRESGASQAHILAPAARAAIIVFSAALALREMGIGESIVNLAFGLLLGAVAVATALAFGLGGREFAQRQLERWNTELRARQAGEEIQQEIGPAD